MNRTVLKGLRDFIIGNTIGQLIVAVLPLVPVLGTMVNLDAGQVAQVVAVLTAANVIWRTVREQVSLLGRIDPR